MILCHDPSCPNYKLPDSKYCQQHYEEMMAKWNIEAFDRNAEHTKDMTDRIQDNVNNPSHYGQGKIEAIEYISDFLTPEEYQGYLRGNIAKYLHRFPYKNGVEDLKKARWYLNRLIEEVEK